jgi:hypothetical protein
VDVDAGPRRDRPQEGRLRGTVLRSVRAVFVSARSRTGGSPDTTRPTTRHDQRHDTRVLRWKGARAHNSFLRLDGSMSAPEREKVIATFYADPKAKVILISLKAGGTRTCAPLHRPSPSGRVERFSQPACVVCAVCRVCRVCRVMCAVCVINQGWVST